jgi:subtilase family protein
MLILASLLLLTPQQGLPSLLSPARTTRRLEPHRLMLKSHDWDTRSRNPVLPPLLRFDSAEAAAAGYYFVQGQPEHLAELKQQIRDLGGQIFDYVPHNTFEAKLPSGAPAMLLAGAWADLVIPVHPAFKLDREIGLGSQIEADPWGRVRVVAELWPDADQLDVEIELQAMDLEILDQVNSGRYLRMTLLVDPSLLANLARVHAIKYLERPAEGGYRNEKSQWVIQTKINGSTKLWNAGLLGNDVYIGHIDGRIQENSCYFDDPTGVSPGPNHRKIKWWDGGGSSDSHGTHTAGSAAGNDLPTGGNGTYNGMAPNAYLVHQSRFPGGSQMLAFLDRAHSHDARIHTNSWGDDFTTQYNAWTRDIDAYSHDNEDGVVMFAVTNGSNLKNPENAKSVVAVGATDKNSPANHGSGGKGPTADGRWKPEVYAPGCSTRSASTSSCGTITMCGTSMASPVVAGGAALIKEYFEDGFYPSGSAKPADAFVPSGSLLRGMLANSSVDMTGVAKYPSNTEGWGRILLDNAAFFSGDGRNLRLVDIKHANGISQGQTLIRRLNIPAGSTEMRVTLAFADEPGTAFSNQPVVNNLDLVAVAPDGTQYHGNILDRNAQGAATANATTFDAKNTLEQIIVYNPMPGKWTFAVVGADVPVGPQGFAGILTY